MTTEPGPDVSTILGELREQIKERRARMTVSDPNDPHALNLAELRRSIESVNDTWFVSAHLPITWETRIVGRMGAYTKRLVRLLLRWYINPIVDQQNDFNAATVRALSDLAAENERLRAALDDLRAAQQISEREA